MRSKILLSIFTWFSIKTFLRLEQHCFSSITNSFQCSFYESNLIQKFQTDWVKSSNKSSLVINNYCSIDYPIFYHPSCAGVLSHLPSLTMVYFIMVFKSFSPTFLVAMSINLVYFEIFTILYKIYYSNNVPCVLGILIITINTNRRLSIQYN